MAETNISPNKADGQVILADHVNELKAAMVTTFVGRNADGQPTALQQLGSQTSPWGTGYINNLISNGNLIDFSGLETALTKIISGQTRTTSTLSDFLRADGSTNEATIEAAITPLVVTIDGASVNVTSDILLPSLTTAGAGATNRCLVNDGSLADQEFTKFLGSENDVIPVDTMGAAMLAKIGEVVCLQSENNELMIVFIKSATELVCLRRGFFFDSAGLPIVRQTLADDDQLSLMSLGYVFLQDDGSSVEVSYLNPIYSFDQPGSPVTGQYWFDLQEQIWKRFDGANFVVINRIPIGLVVINTANCIGSRSFGFDTTFSDLNSISYNNDAFTDTVISSKDIDNTISINGKTIDFRYNKVTFDITVDLESSLTEAASTRYYCYLSQEGEKRIDIERPYRFNPFIQGYYHPYNTWRCVASFFNDGSSNIDSVIDINELLDPTNLVGSVQAFALETPPPGFLEADGSEKLRESFPNLFAKIGVRFGIGDGSTTFNIPDLRGEFIRGWDNGAGNDPDAGSRTDSGNGTTGDNVGTKQANDVQAHAHTQNVHNSSGANDNVTTGTTLSGLVASQNPTVTSRTTGNEGGNETRPTNVYMMYCIKT